MRRSLEAVWNHLRGRPLASSDVARYVAQVEDITPHMDDFDDVAALAASVMVSEALECCRTADNVGPAMQAAISGFEAVAPDREMEPEAQPRLWRQILVRRELTKQLQLVERIGAVTHLDDAAIEALRERLTHEDLAGEVTPTRKPPTAPVTITNQASFEQYRRIVELDLRTSDTGWCSQYAPGSTEWALMLISAWMLRYGRRRDAIDGGSAPLSDLTARQALVARQRALDGAETALPQWDSAIQEMLDLCLQNRDNGIDVTAFDQPHGYGPSLRGLWVASERRGDAALEPWQHILAWARHRPAAWEVEDSRRMQGLAHTTRELGALMAREVTWSTTGDLDYPWAAAVNGQQWQVRLNDFPDDLMYSLTIDGKSVGGFHDWPEAWQRRLDHLE
jgi:hypothetical protein